MRMRVALDESQCKRAQTEECKQPLTKGMVDVFDATLLISRRYLYTTDNKQLIQIEKKLYYFGQKLIGPTLESLLN